ATATVAAVLVTTACVLAGLAAGAWATSRWVVRRYRREVSHTRGRTGPPAVWVPPPPMAAGLRTARRRVGR
ncbi:MAG: hypothetical protein AB7H81_23680, partial [Vicinamibacterales bacterium]